jgi:hypothetical protein
MCDATAGGDKEGEEMPVKAAVLLGRSPLEQRVISREILVCLTCCPFFVVRNGSEMMEWQIEDDASPCQPQDCRDDVDQPCLYVIPLQQSVRFSNWERLSV